MVDSSDFDTRLRRVDSRQNARVKELRRAFAEATPNQQGEVAIEGMHLVEEAIRSGLQLVYRFLQRVGTRAGAQAAAAIIVAYRNPAAAGFRLCQRSS